MHGGFFVLICSQLDKGETMPLKKKDTRIKARKKPKKEVRKPAPVTGSLKEMVRDARRQMRGTPLEQSFERALKNDGIDVD
jgi:hypothetical protein